LLNHYELLSLVFNAIGLFLKCINQYFVLTIHFKINVAFRLDSAIARPAAREKLICIAMRRSSQRSFCNLLSTAFYFCALLFAIRCAYIFLISILFDFKIIIAIYCFRFQYLNLRCNITELFNILNKIESRKFAWWEIF